MEKTVFQAKKVHDLDLVANRIVQLAGDFRILAFYGPMGAGKTTLIRAICRNLQVKHEVTSPTFALVNEYPSGNGPVYHFDFYRINQISEALDFGIDEYFDSGCWCFMEWPDKIAGLLPETLVEIHIAENPDGSRSIRIELPR
jgi:tRNA threonylcarbamoyladenosine biosynthesis protein TsaE